MSETKLRPLVYIAGPISKGDLHNSIAKSFAAFYLLKDAGFAPVCPHLTCFLGSPQAYLGSCTRWIAAKKVFGVTYEEWMEIDLSIVAKCDAVLRLSGESEGADKEVEFALSRNIDVILESDFKSVQDAVQGLKLLREIPWTDSPREEASNSNPTRASILESARQAVDGSRDVEYGSPENNFGRIADYWNDYLNHRNISAVVKPHDVAILLGLVKIARLVNSPTHLDNWIDLAGYAACGGEVAFKES
jgi:hypothetical protein